MRMNLLAICLLILLMSGCASQEQLESVLTQEGVADFDVHGYAGLDGGTWYFFDGTKDGRPVTGRVTAHWWTGFGRVQYYSGGVK